MPVDDRDKTLTLELSGNRCQGLDAGAKGGTVSQTLIK